MDIESIVAQLREELRRIENAINALVGLGSVPARRGRPPKTVKKRTMSASARARISAAQKARWAKQKGKPAKKQAKATPKKTTVRTSDEWSREEEIVRVDEGAMGRAKENDGLISFLSSGNPEPILFGSSSGRG